MDYTVYTAVRNSFESHPSLCDLFKLLAIETWKRIEYGYTKPRVKIFETTITQNLIFTINAYRDQHGLDIDILEALDENVNGNDFELIIRFPGGGVEFYAPIQAKKIYRNGKYTALDHGAQIESLRQYAHNNRAIPFYLLYNYAVLPLQNPTNFSSPPELFGCSLVLAEHLFNNYHNQRRKRDGSLTWQIPHFYDLNPEHTFPWHELVCPTSPEQLISKLQALKVLPDDLASATREIALMKELPSTGFFPINTFTDDDKWINLSDLSVQKADFEAGYRVPGELGSFTRDELSLNEKGKFTERAKREREPIKFSPKNRVILSHNR